MKEKKKIIWMDSLKLLACIGVFWSHFVRVYILRSEVGLQEIGSGIMIFVKLASGFLNGNFWVCVFCIISGYLAYQKKIGSIKELFVSIGVRYLRFVFPFLAMALFIWGIFVFAGFPTAEYEEILKSAALADSYKTAVSMKEICQSIFLFSPVLNAPMWMMQPLFLGNCIIYLYNYLTRKTEERRKLLIAAVLFVLFALAGRWMHNLLYVACCLLGFFFAWKGGWNGDASGNAKIGTAALLVLIVLLSGGQDFLLAIVSKVIPIPSILYMGPYWNMIYAFCILQLLSQVQTFRKGLEWSGFQKLNSLSFAIYLVHWPLICSFSLYMYGWLSHSCSYTGTFLLNFISTNALVFVLAGIYVMTYERWSSNIIGRIKTKFSTLVKRS